MASTQNVRQEFGTPFASFTRPDNTTAYAADDVIADSATAATVMKFTQCSGEVGGGGRIHSVTLIDSAYPGTKLHADLYLFHTAPASYGNDNANFTPTDAEMLNLAGIVTLDGTTAANIREGDGNSITTNRTAGVIFQCTVNETALYGVLVARNAYTPASEEVFKIFLGIEKGS